MTITDRNAEGCLTRGGIPAGQQTIGDATGGYDPRQWGREYQNLANDLDEVRRNLGRNDPLYGELAQVINQLQSLSRDSRLGDPAVIEEMAQQIIDPLKSIEMEMSRELQLLLAKENIRSAQEDEIPRGYSKFVGEYYKKLSTPNATPKQ